MNLNDTIKMLESITDERDRESLVGWLKQTQSLRQQVENLENLKKEFCDLKTRYNDLRNSMNNRDTNIKRLNNRISVLQGKLAIVNRVACKKCRQAFTKLELK